MKLSLFNKIEFVCGAEVLRLRTRQGGNRKRRSLRSSPLTPSQRTPMLQVYCVGWENDRETNHKTSDKIQETWVCSPKGWKGRAESPLLASAEAKPSATSKALPHNSSAALAMPFLPSASCRNLDLPPVNLRFLQSHLTKNAFAIAPTHLCGIAQNSSLEKKINQNITPQT